MRKNIQKIGLSISVLAKSSYNLNKEQTKQTNYNDMHLNSQYTAPLQEISQNIETINSHFNEFHFKILQNDDNIAFVETILQKNLRSQTDYYSVQNLEAKVKKLTEIHQNLQQKNFDQTIENEKLKQLLKEKKNEAGDQNHYLQSKVQNYKNQLIEAQKDNKDLIQKINNLEEKLKNNISYNFKLQDERENNNEQRRDANLRKTGKDLANQASIFLNSMKNLQKIMNVKANENEKQIYQQQIMIKKQEFEKNKKILELMLKMSNFEKIQDENKQNQPGQEQQQNLQKNENIESSSSLQLVTINNHLKQQISIQQDLLKNYKLNIFQLQNKIQEQQQKIVHSDNQFEAVRNNYNSLIIQNTQLQNSIKEINHLHQPIQEHKSENIQEQLQRQSSQYESQLQEKHDQIQNFKNQIMKAQETINLLQKELEKTVSAQKNIKQSVKDTNIQTEILDYQNDLQMNENIIQLKLKLEESEKANIQLQQQHKTQEISLQNFRKQNKVLNIQTDSVNKLIAQQTHDFELIDQLRNEINVLQISIDEYKNQIENNNNQLDKKECNIQNYIQQINNLQKMAENENDYKNKQISQLQSQISQQQTQIQTYQQEKNELNQYIQNLEIINNEKIQEINNKLVNSELEIEKKKDNYNQQLNIIGQAKAQLQNEYNSLKKHLESIYNKNDQEIQRLNGQREEEIKQIQEKDQIINDKLLLIQNLNEQINQLNESLNQAQQISQKHQSTLEKNRDLIALLKDQVQKSVQKQKNQTNITILQQKYDLIQQEKTKIKKENQKLQDQNENLKSQIKQLKNDFEQNAQNQIEKIKEIQIENSEKEDLINDANKVIEELQDFKHDICAKFKHLIQIYVNKISQSIDISSYKGDESSLSINQCFDQIQEVLENNYGGESKLSHNSKITQKNLTPEQNLQLDNNKLQIIKEQQGQTLKKFKNIQNQLIFTEEMFVQNNEEMEYQNKQFQVLIRKLQNYKSKIQKQTLNLNQIQLELQSAQNLNKNLQSEIDNFQNQGQNQQEIEILKHEKTKLQSNLEEISKDKNDLQKQIYDQNQKLQNLTSDLLQKTITINELRNDIQQSKLQKDKKKTNSNSSNSSKNSDQIEQLEIENIELLAKLQKREKEMQELRDNFEQERENKKLDESNNKELDEEQKQKLLNIEAQINLLSNKIILAKEDVRKQIQNQFNAQILQIKDEKMKKAQEILDKCIAQKEIQINQKVQLIKKLVISGEQYLIIEVQSQQQQEEKHIQLVQKNKLDDQQLKYIKNYMPPYQCELEFASFIEDRNIEQEKGDNQIKKVEQFDDQLQELRAEQKEILEEYYNLLIKIQQNVELEDQKDLQTMKDDIQYFNVENLELKHKFKSLVVQNLELKKQIIYQQDQKQLDLKQNLDKNDQDTMSKQFLEKQDDNKYFENNLSNIFMEGQNKIDTSEEMNQNINNNLSLISQKERLNLFNDSHQNNNIIQDQSIHQLKSTELKKSTFNCQQESKVLQNNINNQTKISILEEKLETANFKINDLKKQLKDREQNLKQNEKMNINENHMNESDTSIDLQNNEQYQSLLQHLKGTFIQYLKKVPIIDMANEVLLKIVFSMLNFTSKDIEDLGTARKNLPVYKIDTDLTRKAKKNNQQAKNIESLHNKNFQDSCKASKESEIDQISQGDFTSTANYNDIRTGSDLKTPKAPSTIRAIVTDHDHNNQKSNTPKQNEGSSNAKDAILGFFKKNFKQEQNKIEDSATLNGTDNGKQRKFNLSIASNGGASDEKSHSKQNSQPLAPEKIHTYNKHLKSIEDSDFII